MKNTKLIKTIAAFMLFIPFRLPISVLLIKLFNYTASVGSKSLPIEVLTTNVMITKLIYNLILGAYFCYGIEFLSRDLLGRASIINRGTCIEKPNENGVFWWTGICIALSVVFIALDMWNTYTLSMLVNN
jgi:hypothetical protein